MIARASAGAVGSLSLTDIWPTAASGQAYLSGSGAWRDPVRSRWWVALLIENDARTGYTRIRHPAAALRPGPKESKSEAIAPALRGRPGPDRPLRPGRRAGQPRQPPAAGVQRQG